MACHPSNWPAVKEKGVSPSSYPSSVIDSQRASEAVLTNISEEEVELGWGKDWRGREKEKGLNLSRESMTQLPFIAY